MNCDQAFDAMTDPNGPDNRKLSRHLRSCRRCQQMFETLEPALGLFAAVDGRATETSPAIPTRFASSSVRMAQQIADRLLPTASGSHRNPPQRRLWGAVFAAAVAGVLLSVGLSSMSSHSPLAPPGAAADCPWLNRGTVSDDEPARAVVITCVSCHLVQPRDQQQSQTGVIKFSQELERLVTAWRAIPQQSHDRHLVMTLSAPRAAYHV